MADISPKYVTSITLQQYLVNKNTGLPLAGGYIEFWQDTSHSTPKTVYQLTGNAGNYTYTALGNPVYLNGAGVPCDSSGHEITIYYYPYDEDNNLQLYYISIYSADNILQYNLSAWPNVTAEDNPADQNNTVSNQISNSQFSQVNFVPSQGLMISFDSAISSKSFKIAPDWDLIITSTGAGAVSVGQVSIAGSLNIKTNPPYKLTFSPSGSTVTSLILRQTLSNNPDIWSSTTDDNGYISGIMLVQSLDGQAHTIEMQYVQSGGPSSPQTIVSGSTLTNGYQLLNNTALLNAGTNTDDSNNGAIYIDIVLPTNGYVGLTSVQVCGLNDENSIVNYEQETVNRQIDHLFHYYKTGLDYKPIKSYLTAWDFPLNPAQFNGDSVAAVAGFSAYLWDQTIGYQSVASSLSASRQASGAGRGGLKLTVANTCQVAIVQYLTVPEILSMLNNELSSNIICSSNQSSMKGVISLWYTLDSTLPNINTDSESLVSTLNANGKPTAFNGTWVEVPRSSLGDAIFQLSSPATIDNLQSFGFNGWQLDLTSVDLQNVKYFAIVVGFSSLTATNSILIKSCSLVPGSVPTIPAPQTCDEVLNDCQYYYEKTYDKSVVPGTITSSDIVSYRMTTAYIDGAANVYASFFTIIYKTEKISDPIVKVYNYIDGRVDHVVFYLGGNLADVTFSSYFASYSGGLKSKNFYRTNSSHVITLAGTTFSADGALLAHYTLDSRLGVY